jgi:protein SCO1/2
MTFKPWVYLSALLIIILLIIFLQPDEVEEKLPIIAQIPAFDLIDQDGKQFTLNNLKGNVWLADFIFTTCAGPCPIMTERMSTVQYDLLDINKLKFVSFTVNPDYDTPDVLKKYAKRYNADISTWSFVTGKYEKIQELIANGFKMGDEEEIVFHSTRFALVDHKGNLRGYYSGTEPKDHEVLTQDIHSLIKESQ